MVLIHYTAMGETRAALRRLRDPCAEVSAHYLIGRDGTTFRLVAEERRAWHAGQGEWGGAPDVNSRSIGIELSNTGAEPFTSPQMAALEHLLVGLRARWPEITPERVLGHSDTAPGRKIDPGPHFDWRRLARAGHAVWIDGSDFRAAPDAERFLVAGWRAGYTACRDADMLRTSLRLRFRPWARGGLDADDMALALALARRFPVDAASRDP